MTEVEMLKSEAKEAIEAWRKAVAAQREHVQKESDFAKYREMLAQRNAITAQLRVNVAQAKLASMQKQAELKAALQAMRSAKPAEEDVESVELEAVEA